MFKHLLVWLLIILGASVAYMQGDEPLATEEPVQSSEPLQVFVCVNHNGGHNLFEFAGTEPVGLMFSKTVDVTIFYDGAAQIAADVIHVVPDTRSGTYRWAGTVARDVRPTQNIPSQDICETLYPGQLSGKNRTIQLPMSTDQALAIRGIGAEDAINYEDQTRNLINGAIGLVFRDVPEDGIPHLQILRFSGGDDDTISVAFPDFEEQIDLYAVSRRRVSYIRKNAAGFPTVTKFLDGRASFFSRLDDPNNDSNREFFDNVMAPGQFRMFVEHGEEMIYETGGVLEFSRPSSYVPRIFMPGATIRPIACNDLAVDPFRVPYLREDDYSPYNYLQPEVSNVVGNSTCDNGIIIANTPIPEDGRLPVDGSGGVYQIPAWLVEVVPEN